MRTFFLGILLVFSFASFAESVNISLTFDKNEKVHNSKASVPVEKIELEYRKMYLEKEAQLKIDIEKRRLNPSLDD